MIISCHELCWWFLSKGLYVCIITERVLMTQHSNFSSKSVLTTLTQRNECLATQKTTLHCTCTDASSNYCHQKMLNYDVYLLKRQLTQIWQNWKSSWWPLVKAASPKLCSYSWRNFQRRSLLKKRQSVLQRDMPTLLHGLHAVEHRTSMIETNGWRRRRRFWD